ncbi:MAG: BlaI/MecI/CopY family transcriptional regulator [Dysosmobacter sp.]
MQKLSDREWMVLEALWQMGDAELGTLVEQLRPHTDWNRNTVLTYLTRMEAKGLVRIDKEAVPHRYQAGVDRETCRAQERRSFLNRVYQGAAGGSGGGLFERGWDFRPGEGGAAQAAG